MVVSSLQIFLQKENIVSEYKIVGYNSIKEIFGVGNFFINLTDKQENVLMPLVMLDSNMYGDGWFFSGFDCIHEDQTEWCMNRLSKLKKINPDIKAMAFFHMPVREFKEAYEMWA